jgi:hypothetical protein
MLSAACKRVLAARAEHTKVMIAFLANDLAHCSFPTLRTRQEAGALSQRVQFCQQQLDAAVAAMGAADTKAINAYLNPDDTVAEALQTGAILIPADGRVH